jgi:hypothetical protein
VRHSCFPQVGPLADRPTLANAELLLRWATGRLGTAPEQSVPPRPLRKRFVTRRRPLRRRFPAGRRFCFGCYRRGHPRLAGSAAALR